MQLIRAGRDMRVDFFRGLALWWIFTDHIPANWINQFSLRNFALCDSAEVFVLLAGYGAGLAYGRSMDRNGWVYAASDTLKRAWTLYIAHIFLFVVFAAQVSYSATTLDRADYLDEIHLDVLGEEPYRAMLEALMLHFQPAYLDILPMYIALLVLFALVMPLLRWPQLLALCSFTLYAVARLAGLEPAVDHGGGVVFQSPGLAVALHPRRHHGLSPTGSAEPARHHRDGCAQHHADRLRLGDAIRRLGTSGVGGASTGRLVPRAAVGRQGRSAPLQAHVDTGAGLGRIANDASPGAMAFVEMGGAVRPMRAAFTSRLLQRDLPVLPRAGIDGGYRWVVGSNPGQCHWRDRPCRRWRPGGLLQGEGPSSPAAACGGSDALITIYV